MTTPTPRTFEDFFEATYASQYPQSGVPDGIREVALVTWEARERDLAAAQEARQAAEADKVTWRNAHSMEHLKRLDAEALAAQNAKNAERYRWLRDNKHLDLFWSVNDAEWNSDSIDADIDAAIAGEKK